MTWKSVARYELQCIFTSNKKVVCLCVSIIFDEVMDEQRTTMQLIKRPGARFAKDLMIYLKMVLNLS